MNQQLRPSFEYAASVVGRNLPQYGSSVEANTQKARFDREALKSSDAPD
jgi:hypothetical protein